MFGAERLLRDPDRPLQNFLRQGKLLLRVVELRETAQRGSDLVAGDRLRFEQRQSPTQKRFGAREFTAVEISHAEPADRGGFERYPVLFANDRECLVPAFEAGVPGVGVAVEIGHAHQGVHLPPRRYAGLRESLFKQAVRFGGAADFAQNVAEFVGQESVVFDIGGGRCQSGAQNFLRAGIIAQRAIHGRQSLGCLGHAGLFVRRRLPDREGGFQLHFCFGIANQLVQGNAKIVGGKAALNLVPGEGLGGAKKLGGRFKLAIFDGGDGFFVHLHPVRRGRIR